MSVQGQLLDITVIGCRNLKDTEWISKQDPYVILEYAGNKYRTKTDTDGGRNPNFNDTYILSLIEGLREINVSVWNRNILSPDDFIGFGKIILQKVLIEGYHDSTWPLTSRNGRRAGEIRVILRKGAQKVTSAQQVAPVHQSPPMYPPSSPAYYPPPAYAAASPYPSPAPPPSVCSCYPPVYAPYPPSGQTAYPTYGTGAYTAPTAFGAQPPYPPQPYPQPMYPPQGYGGYSGYGAPPAGHYPPSY